MATSYWPASSCRVGRGRGRAGRGRNGGRGDGRVSRGRGRGGRGRNGSTSLRLVDEQDEIRDNIEHEYMEKFLVEEEEKRVAEDKARQDEFDKKALKLTLEEEARF
ncbi:hypothetical protein Tco_0382234 [Tanacetum coccineum]